MTPDSAIVDTVLRLLRDYGWETAPRKLQAEMHAARDPAKEEALQFFSGWMLAERGAYAEALQAFEQCQQVPRVAGRTLFESFLLMCQHIHDRAMQPTSPDPVWQPSTQSKNPLEIETAFG
jgi:hypothetical protein